MANEPRIDEAFRHLSEVVLACSDLVGEIVDGEGGIRMRLEEIGIETPIEMDVVPRAGGRPELGCAPPLYPVDLTVPPVFHRLRFTARVETRAETSGGPRDG